MTWRVVVGSLNPVKIAAARAVFGRWKEGAVTVDAVDVPSGVAAQPWDDAETRRGALNRARQALRQDGADFGVGLEGGLLEVDGALYTSAWCAVVRADGVIGIAGGENLQLPSSVVEHVRAGRELGEAVDAVTGRENTKHHGGAIGAFTAGRLTRQTAYEHVLTLALARFLGAEYYQAEYYQAEYYTKA
jgi:inosine/xanthosine triphosphatase